MLHAANTTRLTPALLHSIDNKDSDGDGFTNAEEFAADTLPGDPNSKPAGKPPGKTAAVKALSPPPEEETGPFYWRTVLFPAHAQHPVLVHFPIALFVISLLFDVLGRWRKNPMLSMAAYYNLIIAAISAVPTVATGLLAWRFLLNGAPLRGNLLLHLILGITTLCLLGVLLWIRSRQRGLLEGTLGRAYWWLAFITVAVVALTGHLGGFLAGLG